MHSLRLYPIAQGASNYQITGIASECCLVVLTDIIRTPSSDKISVVRQKESTDYIFLSMRDPYSAMVYFYETILPGLSDPFVLITGGSDITLPDHDLDYYRPFTEYELTVIRNIANHPLLVCWFTENLISNRYKKMKPLLLGYLNELPQYDVVDNTEYKTGLVMCCHHVHEFSKTSFQTRQLVNQLVHTEWNSFCDWLEPGLTFEQYAQEVRKYKFNLCVHGGGIDPCPKLWMSLMMGSIPIVAKSTLSPVLDLLVVYQVDDWTADCIDPVKLEQFYTDNKHRLLEQQDRLYHKYWWNYIVNMAKNIQTTGTID